MIMMLKKKQFDVLICLPTILFCTCLFKYFAICPSGYLFLYCWIFVVFIYSMYLHDYMDNFRRLYKKPANLNNVTLILLWLFFSRILFLYLIFLSPRFHIFQSVIVEIYGTVLNRCMFPLTILHPKCMKF